VVALVLVSGLLIGFVEELLTRGIAVKTLRHAGDAEWTVAALSSLVFAASHGIDIFGQALATVGFRWFTRSPSA
jgi:membrane protease YdiL (CAAX protease family)